MQEVAFLQQFGNELRQAWDYINKYRNLFQVSGQPIPTSSSAPIRKQKESNEVKTLEEEYLQSAWEQFYAAFQNINKKLSTIISLDLLQCSPGLLNSKDLDFYIRIKIFLILGN